MVPKFRAFLIEAKTMHNILAIDFSRNMYCLQIGKATIGEWFWFREIELIQFTGLKDKNGVDIFEGDCFVKSFQMIEIPTGRTFLKDEIGVVKFIDGQFVCHIDGWGSEPLKDVLGYQNTNDDHWKDGLVIGNIWENPELLEQANEN